MNLSNLAKKHVKHTTWPMEKKIAAVTQYLVLGNMVLVAASTGIDVDLLRQWKMQPWWKDVEREIRATENIGTDTKLTKIVDRSLDVVMDRLENGDYIYNQKTGQIVRKPVNMKDAVVASKEMLTKRELLRGNATERKETTQISMEDQLKALAYEFAKFNKPASLDVVDVVAKVVPEEPIEDILEGETEFPT
jgi:transposase-like protein